MQKRELFASLVIFVLLFSIFPVIAQETPSDNSNAQQDDSQIPNDQENDFDDDEDEIEDEDEFDDESEETFDEEDDLEELIEEAETFDDVLEVSAGITPDSAFYFVEDKILTRFRGDLENREKKVAEMKAMAEACAQGEQTACQGLRTAFEKYKSHAEKFEKEVSPEERQEAEDSSKRIRGAVVREIAQNAPPTLKDELVREVITQEDNIANAAEIADKIANLCRELANLDPEQFHRVCKTENDSPRWQKDLFEDLSAEQESEAKVFFDVLSQCMRTEGKQCKCAEIPHKAFSDMCSTVAPLATACNEGDESACEQMDERTEEMFEILEDAPHLQRVLERLDDFEEERFDNHMPRECQEAGISPRDRNARSECMKIMIERGEEIPDECRPALREAINSGVTSEREFRKICEEIMFKLDAPQECIDAGIKNPKECGKFMFQQNAPQECIDAGLTGESPRDHKKCEEIMRRFEGDRSGPNRGPGYGLGFNCKGIDDPEKRLECYDDAINRAHEFREGDEFEGQGPSGGWPEPCVRAGATTRESCERVMRESGEREEFREGDFRPPEGCEGLTPEECGQRFSLPPEEFAPPPEEPLQETSPEPSPEPEPTPEPSTPITGGAIINNPFLRYYFR